MRVAEPAVRIREFAGLGRPMAVSMIVEVMAPMGRLHRRVHGHAKFRPFVTTIIAGRCVRGLQQDEQHRNEKEQAFDHGRNLSRIQL